MSREHEHANRSHLVHPEISPAKDTRVMNDGELASLLAGIGNHDGKALLLISMEDGVVYDTGGFDRLLSSRQGYAPRIFSHKLPWNWAKDSIEPVGLVAKVVMDQDTGKMGFLKNEKGAGIGEAYAGHLLALSEAYPTYSLSKLFSSTNSASGSIVTYADTKGDLQTDRIRAPLIRLRIFRELATRPMPARTIDIIDALESDYPETTLPHGRGIERHLFELADAGIINYQSTVYAEPVNFYSTPFEYLVEDPPPHRGQATLTNEVFSIISSHKGELTSDELFQIYKARNPDKIKNYEKWERGMKASIRGILGHLIKQAYITKRGVLGEGTQSVVSLNKKQEELLTKVVEIIDTLASGDPDFIEKGRRKAAAIRDDPARFFALLEKSKRMSSHANAVAFPELAGNIISFLADPNNSGTVREVHAYLRTQGLQYTRHPISDLLRRLKEEGVVSANKIKNVNHYTVTPPENDLTTDDPIEKVDVTEHALHEEPDDTGSGRSLEMAMGDRPIDVPVDLDVPPPIFDREGKPIRLLPQSVKLLKLLESGPMTPAEIGDALAVGGAYYKSGAHHRGTSAASATSLFLSRSGAQDAIVRTPDGKYARVPADEVPNPEFRDLSSEEYGEYLAGLDNTPRDVITMIHQGHPPQTLLSTLYPDMPPEESVRILRPVLSRLRHDPTTDVQINGIVHDDGTGELRLQKEVTEKDHAGDDERDQPKSETPTRERREENHSVSGSDSAGSLNMNKTKEPEFDEPLEKEETMVTLYRELTSLDQMNSRAPVVLYDAGEPHSEPDELQKDEKGKVIMRNDEIV